MKKIYLLLLVLSIQLLQAQDDNLKRANRLFERTFYNEAIPLYKSIIQDNTSQIVLKNLADCYYYTNDFNTAQNYYKLLITNFGSETGDEYYFKYSQTLKASGKYNDANAVLQKYYASLSDKDILIRYQRGLQVLENVTAIGERYQIKNLKINTPNTEFGGFVTNDTFVFAAVKSKMGMFDKRFKWNGESYLDLMAIPLRNVNAVDSLVIGFDSKINTAMHESNAVFTKDGKTMFFTRNNYKKGRRGKNKDKVSNLQLFRASWNNGKWTNIISLPFNNDNYSTEHPALSIDEKTLYFASDMPGTLGSFDIFSVEIYGDTFGVPVNLGNLVNTARKEQFPFVSKDNKLYFSSNEHEGYGALDVFVSALQNGVPTRAENVGLPINSGYDDFAFFINSDTKEGFFSSNRLGGKGSDDIYSLTEEKPLIIEDCKQYITGIITDVDTKLPLENVMVQLQNADGEIVQRSITTSEGKLSFEVLCKVTYKITAEKDNYTSASKKIVINAERKKNNDASMQIKSNEAIKREQQLVLEEEERNRLTALALQQEKEKVAQAEKIKSIAITAKRNQELVEAKKIEKVATILANEKDVVKDRDRLIIKTDPIYFDYNLWYIRKDSKTILNKVVALMKKYPEMIVEIGSHTDNRGNGNFNKDLSQKRAQATRDYFLEQGISPKQIFAKGYGESVQIVKCIPEESCTEEEHELNRRSEFVIKSL
ncbi:OmpA family protein [Flavobacterium sp. XS2P14]|uniref:OmpA family protein n=1 Tax=Flavobacterium sp. XS2P14 TaxID=3401735 RepID=UPI003AAFEE04